MKIHNLLEDIVTKKVDEIFSDKKIIKTLGICTCDQCRLDVVCFALNRLPPRYIVSGKGATHMEAELTDDFQNVTDIVSIINDGIKKVKNTKRSTCSTAHTNLPNEGPVINFPSITGRIYNGETFEPLSDTDIYLYLDDVPVEMMNSNWTNPFVTSDNTPGTYSFWPKTIGTQSYDPHKFQFELRINTTEEEPHSHFFSIEIIPESQIKDVFELISVYKVDDVYIFN